jgi:signal transduction histidine kinase
VRNLVENALLHGRGPVSVDIGPQAGGGVRLTVADGGPGIPTDLLADFNGRRGKAALPVPYKGRAGLGLSIARAIVEAHGGKLALTNRPGAGCLAEIVLPAARAGSA